MNATDPSTKPFQRMASMPTMQVFASSYCNLRCPYCSISDSRKSVFKSNILASPYVIDQLKSWPQTHFYISGGEPLIHEGIDRFIQVAAGYNHIISVDTNGVIPEHKLKHIAACVPRNSWGFFNISHHILSGVSRDHIHGICTILRDASIPHFVKYIGTPDEISQIRNNMAFFRDQGSGVAVTILETNAIPWKGKTYPADYSDEELLALLDMVTLGTHALQFFGGILSQGHPCKAGNSYVAYNMKDSGDLIPCCHCGNGKLSWSDTVFGGASPSVKPCTVPTCHGDIMFILGLQGIVEEMARFEQVCLGHSPVIGLAQALAYIKSVADKCELRNHARFQSIFARYSGGAS